MANSLKIRVGVEAGKPDSRFTVQEGGTITLKNDGSAMLKINFSGGSSPLCPVAATAAVPQLSVDLTAGETREYKACAVVTEKAFPYTATVGTTQEIATIIVEKATPMTPEIVQPAVPDPSIVIHHELMGENYFFAATGLLVGVVLSMFAENRWGPGRTRPRP
jgi:uncharacterized protein with von Willebrand factor type A (vWA) domain